MCTSSPCVFLPIYIEGGIHRRSVIHGGEVQENEVNTKYPRRKVYTRRIQQEQELHMENICKRKIYIYEKEVHTEKVNRGETHDLDLPPGCQCSKMGCQRSN